jgi:hypothetical protein
MNLTPGARLHIIPVDGSFFCANTNHNGLPAIRQGITITAVQARALFTESSEQDS